MKIRIYATPAVKGLITAITQYPFWWLQLSRLQSFDHYYVVVVVVVSREKATIM